MNFGVWMNITEMASIIVGSLIADITLTLVHINAVELK